MKLPTTFYLDLETNGLRSLHGTRKPWQPIRVTDFGFSRLRGGKMQGLVSGWTNYIGDMIEQHGIQSSEKISDDFWRDLVMKKDYDPSVARNGSVLNSQVKSHVNAYLSKKSTGGLKSGAEYIQEMIKSLQKEINSQGSARLVIYNKDFDLNVLAEEMGASSKIDEWRDFLQRNKRKLIIESGERQVHKALFERMLADPKAIPSYSSSKAFEKAARFGRTTLSMGEGVVEHKSLRVMMDDIRKVTLGISPSQVYGGASPTLRAELSKIRDFRSYERAQEAFAKNPLLGAEFEKYYQSRVTQGFSPSNYIPPPSFDFTIGWKQEEVAKLLGLEAQAHRALKDTFTTAQIEKKLVNDPKARAKLADILLSEDFKNTAVKARYAKYWEEWVSKGGKIPPSLSGPIESLLRSPGPAERLTGFRAFGKPMVGLAIAAGAFMAAGAAYRKFSKDSNVESIKEMIGGRIEALRRPTSQWDLLDGIRTNDNNNVSAFGSGRNAVHGMVWNNDSYGGVQFHPLVITQRNMFISEKSQAEYQMYRAEAAQRSSRFGTLSSDEIRRGHIDLDDYVVDVLDADSISLRRKKLWDHVPLLSYLISPIERFINAGGSGSIEVRLAGIDAPETAHPRGQTGGGATKAQPYADAATAALQELIGAADYIKLEQGKTYGRYVGKLYTEDHSDIQQTMVQRGWAASQGPGSAYWGQQQAAMSAKKGMWQSRFMQGYGQAQARGIKSGFYQISNPWEIATRPQAAATLSMAMYNMERPTQLHGVRDQVTRNYHVFPQIYGTPGGDSRVNFAERR